MLRLVLSDISLRKAADEQIKRLAFYDPLTDLPNRRLLMDRLAQALAAGKRHRRQGALIFVDLDNFKTINDTLGYFQGDLLLVQVQVRWQHPERGLLGPAEFTALAEETGLILPLGQWVLETACALLAAWATQPEMAHLTMAVNVSARQFYQDSFVEQVQAALKGEGVGFSLDDFGTGYSSLSYLKRLPLDQLKIDQSFVCDLFTDPNDAVNARAIVALGHSLRLQVMAEGVETTEQHGILARLGCDAYQGYCFGRATPTRALTMS